MKSHIWRTHIVTAWLVNGALVSASAAKLKAWIRGGEVFDVAGTL